MTIESTSGSWRWRSRSAWTTSGPRSRSARCRSVMRRAVQIALVFGFWDAIAPLVGGLPRAPSSARRSGPSRSTWGRPCWARTASTCSSGRSGHPEPDEVDHPWVTLFGLPLALSVDNLIAGTGLGLLGFSPSSRPSPSASSPQSCRSSDCSSDESPSGSFPSGPTCSAASHSSLRRSCYRSCSPSPSSSGGPGRAVARSCVVRPATLRGRRDEGLSAPRSATAARPR